MKTIKITVEGGVIQNITGIPEGIAIAVFDYDTEGNDLETLRQDEDGEDCIISLWTNKN